jgi:hypothetical protein
MRAAVFVVLLHLCPVSNPLHAHAAEATSVPHLTLRQTIDLATTVFAGTVTSAKPEGGASGQVIHTNVEFTDIVVAKGPRSQGPTVLTFRGGTANGKNLIVRGQPRFKLGRRYIIMSRATAESPDAGGFPVVGVYHGYFQVVAKGANNEEIVYSWQDFPLAGFEGDRAVVVGWMLPMARTAPSNVDRSAGPLSTKQVDPSVTIETAPPLEELLGPLGLPLRDPAEAFTIIHPDRDPGTRVTEAEFLRYVRIVAGGD